MDDYVSKPIRTGELISKIETVLTSNAPSLVRDTLRVPDPIVS